MSNVPARVDAQSVETANAATALVMQAHAYRCEDREGFRRGGEMLRDITGARKTLDSRRLIVTGPISAAIEEINSWFKGPLDALARAKQRVADGMAAYQKAEQDREAEANRQAAEQHQAEQEELKRRAQRAAEQGNVEKAAQLTQRALSLKPEQADIIAPKSAGVSLGEAWEFEIVDESKIPREYLTPDLPGIGKLVRALKSKEGAESKIPGIRVFTRVKSVVRSG